MKTLRSILLAEDNPLDVELTIEALSDFKLANNIVAVSDGVKALEYLTCTGEFVNRSNDLPSVILLDIKMPRMDGIQVLERLRTDERFRKIPVVMLTSSREEPDLKRCYELGVNAYVVKPVNFEDFIQAIKSIGIFWAVLNELPTEY